MSTERQSEQGVSLKVQREQCLRYVREHEDWLLVRDETADDEVFQDVLSGLETEKRLAYQRILLLARQRRLDVILIFRYDRLGRDDAELISLGRELGRLNVKLVSASEGERDEFMLNLGFLLARRESAELSKRVTPALRKRAQQGLWVAAPPFGYRMVKDHKGILDVYESEAAIVRQLFQRAAEGVALNQLTIWLNSLTVDGQRLESPRGVYFRARFVRDVLTSPAYIGQVRYGVMRKSKIEGTYRRPEDEHVLVQGLHQPLVSVDLYNRVQGMLRTAPPWRARTVGRRYLLVGLVRCGICGCTMKGRGSKWVLDEQGYKVPQQSNYICEFKGHGAPGGPMVDRYVLDQLTRLPMGAHALADVRTLLAQHADQQPDRAKELQAARARLEQEARRAADRLMGDEEPTPIERTVYRAKMAEIQGQIDQIDAELGTILKPALNPQHMVDQAEGWLRAAGSWAAILEHATLDEQAEIIAGAIQYVTYTKTGVKQKRRSTGVLAITWQPWAEVLLMLQDAQSTAESA